MDTTLFRGIAAGSLAAIVLFTIVLTAGSEPRMKTAKHDCVCPDSERIESPRGVTAH